LNHLVLNSSNIGNVVQVMTRVLQAKEDVDFGWLMVGLEYQAAAPSELGDCMRDVVTALSKFREVQRKYVLQALNQSHRDAADSIRHTEDEAGDAVSLARDEDSHVNRTESEATARLLSTLKDDSAAVLVDSFFPQLIATPCATLPDLEHLTFLSQLYGSQMEPYEWTMEEKREEQLLVQHILNPIPAVPKAGGIGFCRTPQSHVFGFVPVGEPSTRTSPTTPFLITFPNDEESPPVQHNSPRTMQELSEIPVRPGRDFPDMAAVSFRDVIDDQDEASSFPADDLPSSVDAGVKELSEQEPPLR
jgi:hypothetical protein